MSRVVLGSNCSRNFQLMKVVILKSRKAGGLLRHDEIMVYMGCKTDFKIPIQEFPPPQPLPLFFLDLHTVARRCLIPFLLTLYFIFLFSLSRLFSGSALVDIFESFLHFMFSYRIQEYVSGSFFKCLRLESSSYIGSTYNVIFVV